MVASDKPNQPETLRLRISLKSASQHQVRVAYPPSTCHATVRASRTVGTAFRVSPNGVEHLILANNGLWLSGGRPSIRGRKEGLRVESCRSIVSDHDENEDLTSALKTFVYRTAEATCWLRRVVLQETNGAH